MCLSTNSKEYEFLNYKWEKVRKKIKVYPPRSVKKWADQSFTCLTSVSFLHSSWSKSRVWQNCTCLIQPKMGIVSCPTLSITKLLNQQEAGCIHLGSKRSFLMRRRSVFHHIYPPNSKKVWCCIWWKVERPTFVLVPLFCLPKRKHCKQPVS